MPELGLARLKPALDPKLRGVDRFQDGLALRQVAVRQDDHGRLVMLGYVEGLDGHIERVGDARGC